MKLIQKNHSQEAEKVDYSLRYPHLNPNGQDWFYILGGFLAAPDENGAGKITFVSTSCKIILTFTRFKLWEKRKVTAVSVRTLCAALKKHKTQCLIFAESGGWHCNYGSYKVIMFKKRFKRSTWERRIQAASLWQVRFLPVLSL